MIVLWDLDDTLFDWTKRSHEGLRRHPITAPLADRDLRSFDLFSGVTPEQHPIMQAMLDEPGFYEHLEPRPGAIESYQATVEAGHEVFICSTPWARNPHSSGEKMLSVEKHLGKEAARRTILTADKTLVHGDALLDDRDRISGVARPTWTRVWIDQPWNQVDPRSLAQNTMNSRGLRIHGDLDPQRVLTMLDWVEHIRQTSHNEVGQVDDQCLECDQYWSRTR